MTLPSTLCEVYFQGIAFRRPDRFLVKRDGSWRPVSTDDFAGQVRRCAGALIASGIGRGDRVAIFSYNRIEWAVVDYACLLIGAVDVPLYSTLPADQAAYILKDSGARIVFVENGEMASKAGTGIPIVSFEAGSFDAFLMKGGSLGDTDLRARAGQAKPADLATLIYTSGTTGQPKGVMLTHGNLASNVAGCLERFPVGPEDLNLSFLPLSHSFQRMVDFVLFGAGASIAYAENTDAVAANLVEVRPTIMAAVPRFYEKVRQKVLDNVGKLRPTKQGLFHWATAVGALEAGHRRQGRRAPLGVRWRYFWARLLVLRKIQAKTGGRIRFFVSGGAALDRSVAEFFFSLGLTILEGYGLTETSPVITISPLEAIRLGTVGPPIPGCEVKIAADGEVLARGPNIMKGYYHKPEETAAVIVDGWFHTGDIGEVDADGYLRITDRKKDLFKTSGGKYVAPQPIENRLKLCPYVKNAVVLGEQRKFAVALVVPDHEAAQRAGGETQALVQQAVDAINAGLGSWEQIKKFAFVEKDFTIEGGELTPTLKVKRRVVAERYRDLIDRLYGEKADA